MIQVREATISELSWINDKYSEVGFQPSDFDHERIVIAETNGEKCGLGRLVCLQANHQELGGIYVFESHRGKKIAEHIVANLCHHLGNNKITWCLPFEPLLSFYAKFGFTEWQPEKVAVPDKIKSKLDWCNQVYDQKVLLLVRL